MVELVKSGIPGLDDVLLGGLPKGSVNIIIGTPGSGKTTLSFQFLHHGATKCDEHGIYLTFEELPSQLYRDMGQLGWNLRQLENSDKLRVVCISPEVMTEQMVEPGGAFDQLIDEIDAKRIVIDSISLFRYGLAVPDEQRKILYELCNVLRKKGLTSLLIQERTETGMNQIPFEYFVVDGVISLSVRPHMERYRERVIEVIKMRGKPFLEGEHVYRISGQGFYVIPVFDAGMDHRMGTRKVFSTELQGLDQMLGGGIVEGGVYIFDTNSRADYKHLFTTIICAQLRQGRKALMLPGVSIGTLVEYYQLHGVSLQRHIDTDSLYLVEHYGRPYPTNLSKGVMDVSAMDNDQFKSYLHERLLSIGKRRQESNIAESWLVYHDLNTIFSARGTHFIHEYFARQVAFARTNGITLIAQCNFKEVGEATASYLQRLSDTVIRTWMDRSYQYIQITKSPGGGVSDIKIVEHTSDWPYVRLV